MKTLTVTNRSKGDSVIGDHVSLADTSLTRLIGLMGRSSLEPGGGMLIRPSTGVHMFFMRFAIDAISLDRSGKVTHINSRLKPWRIGSVSFRTQEVLELPAGTAAALNIEIGDVLQFTEA
jgi:uncharacterized protein